MSDARWDRLQSLYEEALAADGDARAALLARVRADDPALAHELGAMLRHGAAADSLLDRGVGDVVRGLIDDAPLAVRPPAAIGPYRIVRPLGAGGMGVVYLVERTDVGGLAALKVLRDGWISEGRRERFRMEQRTLARLRHPGIAQLHDAGTLDDGTPWFVMEYVEGTSLTAYCAGRRSTVEERLRLLRGVAEAVQYAHAHAVIHRDLKPSNVLVTATGDVKLLDFGIAKHLDDTDGADERTATGFRMLTPAYAAPEQLRGDPVGVHTDVHALGALLYELLSGRRPFAGRDGAGAEAPARRTDDAPRLEVVTAGAGSPPGRAARAELEVVVRTAMHPEPARRYRTVDALVRDIDHYLRREPLEARPDSLGYRTDRFVRRNWRAVTVGAALGIVLVALTAFYTAGLARARDAAVAEAVRTARIQRFMLALFEGGDADAGPADTLRVRELVAQGVREAAALDAEPAVQAELFATLGGLQQQLGQLAAADSLLQRALDARRALHGEAHPDVAATLTALARLRVAQARLDEAESFAREAVARTDQRLPATDPRAIEARAALGRVLQEQARWPEAIAEQEEVLRRLAADVAGIERADALVQLASSHFYAGALDVSDSLNRAALDIYRTRRGDAHPRVAEALINLGAAEFERGRYAEAEPFYRDALARLAAWHGGDHPATASALTMLGRSLNFQGKDAAAVGVLERALLVQERAHGPHHPTVASALNDLATIALRNGRHDEAERQWRRVEGIYLAVHGERHWLVAVARSNLGSASNARGDYRGAETFLRQAVALFEESQGPAHVNTGIARVKLGRALLRQSRWREALAESERGLAVLTALQAAPQGFVDAARTDITAAQTRLGGGER